MNNGRMLRNIFRMCTALAGVLAIGMASVNVEAQSHSATLKCTPPTSQVAGFNFYRSGVKVNVSLLGACGYVDSAVMAGASYSYTARSVDSNGVESVDSNAVVAMIPANPPPPPTGPQVGNRISVISTANIRATAVNNGFGTLYATEPSGALGTVLAVSTATIPNVTATWIQVKFDSCMAAIPNCTGWMGSNNMTVVTTPPPPPPPSTLTSNGCTKTTTTLDCTFGYTNMPSGTVATINGSAAGKTAQQTIIIP